MNKTAMNNIEVNTIHYRCCSSLVALT